MVRSFALAAFTTAIFCALPVAHAQDDLPEFDGDPPPLQIPNPAPPKPTLLKAAAKLSPRSTDLLRTEEARLAPQAQAQDAEQLRLERQAAELISEQGRLDARAAQIAGEERQLAQLRIDQEAADKKQLAELERQRSAPTISQPQTRSAELPAKPEPPRARPRLSRINYESSRRPCTRAGTDEAIDRDFFAARYQSAPRFVERELLGVVRLDDSQSYLLVAAICELDDEGTVVDFAMLR